MLIVLCGARKTTETTKLCHNCTITSGHVTLSIFGTHPFRELIPERATNNCTMVNHAKSNALKSQIDRQRTTWLKQLPFTRPKRPSPLEENQLHSDRSDS